MSVASCEAWLSLKSAAAEKEHSRHGYYGTAARYHAANSWAHAFEAMRLDPAAAAAVCRDAMAKGLNPVNAWERA